MRNRLVHIVLGVMVLGLPWLRPGSSASAAPASPPPEGGYFSTLPPGSALPSEADCATRVHSSAWEPRPENNSANQTTPSAVSLPGFTPTDGGVDQRARGLADKVTGNFKGTTDEIIQWASCKWGFNDDTVRAQAVSESSWYQSTLGDSTGNQLSCQAGYVAPCPQSFGLLQVKATAWRGTFPSSRDSTAFNVDYALMVRRLCVEGLVNWLYAYPGSTATYRSGDDWGCIGFWYSGSWYGAGTQAYIDGVRHHLTTKPWRSWPDRSTTPAAGSFTVTAPASASSGKPVTISWSAGSGQTRAKDWIAIFRPGAPNTSYGEWHYTGGAATGTMTFTAPAAAGTYEFRYLVNDGYTAVGTSGGMAVGSGLPPPTASFTLTAPASAAGGRPVSVSWVAPSGHTSPKDWIAIYRPGAPNTSYGEWHYTGGAAAGTMTFTAPPAAGTYEFRYLVNDGYTAVGTSGGMTVG